MPASIAVAFLGVLTAPVADGADPPITWIAQERFVQAQTTNELERVDADGFDVFDERLVLTEEGSATIVRTLSDQYSRYASTMVFVRGRTRVIGETVHGDFVVGQGVSRADFVFEADRPVSFTLVCDLAATGHLEDFPAAAVRIIAPDGSYLLDEIIYPQESGSIRIEGELEPGVHEFKSVSRSTVMLGLLPQSVTAESAMSLTFALDESCLADLDDDGSVNAGDVTTLLSYWGTDPDGLPDFNYDGVVDADDLAYLMQRWGACEPP